MQKRNAVLPLTAAENAPRADEQSLLCADATPINKECTHNCMSGGSVTDASSAVHASKHAPPLSAEALVAPETPLGMKSSSLSSTGAVGYSDMLRVSKFGTVSLQDNSSARCSDSAVASSDSVSRICAHRELLRPAQSRMPVPPDAYPQHWAEDQLHMPLVMRPAPEADPDEADVWPDSEALRAAVAFYAADMRDESLAGSDDDNKYSALDDSKQDSSAIIGTSPSLSLIHI